MLLVDNVREMLDLSGFTAALTFEKHRFFVVGPGCRRPRRTMCEEGSLSDPLLTLALPHLSRRGARCWDKP